MSVVTALVADGAGFSLEPVSLFIDAPGEFVEMGSDGDPTSTEFAVVRPVPEEAKAVYGIVTADARGRIISWNAGAEALVGYTADEVIGENLKLLMPEHDSLSHDAHLTAYLETGETTMLGRGRTVDGRRKNGSVFPMDLVLSESVVGATRIYTGVFRDISRRRRAEQSDREREGQLRQRANDLSAALAELDAQKTTLEQSNSELEQFAYVASHDLQEPLRKIQAFGTRLVASESENLSERGADYLQRMHNAAERMQVLINDLLSYSRVRSRAKEPAPVELGSVVDGVLGDLEVAIEEAEAKITIAELPVIRGDPVQFRQLFQNLLGNALKFRVPDRVPMINVSVSLDLGDEAMTFESGFAPNELWRITVEDNGIGFDQAYADRIFGIFQRLHGRSEYAGTGVGLAICKKIVEQHDGTIDAESAPGEGARFVMRFPKR
jgi:two-component system sensor kinase FixL